MAPYFYNNNKVVPCRIQYYIHLYSTHLLHICLFHRGIFNQGRTQQLFVYIYKVTGVSWCLTYSQLINFFFLQQVRTTTLITNKASPFWMEGGSKLRGGFYSEKKFTSRFWSQQKGPKMSRSCQSTRKNLMIYSVINR